jgi:hypothetical protein
LPVEARLKVHLRRRRLGGRDYRIVTLRPGTDVFFSTNYYHDTWHLVSDERGSRLLARLLWGLAYQRRAGTMVLLHGTHLRPTPFDGARSGPVLLLPSHLTSPDPTAFRQLKTRLGRLGPPDQTIRWQTFGLDAELLAQKEEGLARWDREQSCLGAFNLRALWRAEQMRRCGGLICYSAPPPILRTQALFVHGLHVTGGDPYREMDYHFLAERASAGAHFPDGEVQIFSDYRDRVAAAIQARREVLARPDGPTHAEALEEVISRRRDVIKKQRRANRARARHDVISRP